MGMLPWKKGEEIFSKKSSTYTKAGTTFTISLFKTNSLTCGLFFWSYRDEIGLEFFHDEIL